MPRKRRRRGPSPETCPLRPRPGNDPSATILHLPPEMLVHVFSFLPFAVWAETLRLVCQRFRGVAELGLNTALPRLARQLRLQARYMRQTLVAAVAARGVAGRSLSGAALASPETLADAAAATISRQQSRSAADADERKALVPICRAYTAVCAARAQLDLLHAATWRYTQSLSPGHVPVACFYGGRVLDNAARVLHLSSHDPDLLGATFFRRDGNQALTSASDSCDRWRLIEDAKRFINHFERVTERTVNSRPSDWGAKAVDLLHCLEDSQRAQQSCNTSIDVSTASFRLESTWRLRRSWFLSVVLNDTGNGGTYSWREDAGYMHLRVRRLVCAHNNHLLHPQRHARALLGPAPTESAQSSSGSYASVYSGFGDYGGRFYYYGNMNARALRSKILHGAWPPPPPSWPPMQWLPLTEPHTSFPSRDTADDIDDDDDEEELLAVLDADPEVDLNLYIKVNLQCPLRLAPYRVLRELSTEQLEATHRDSSAPYHLSIDIYSPENARQRLPTVFRWQMPTEVSSPTITFPPAPPPSPSYSPQQIVPGFDLFSTTTPSSPAHVHGMEDIPEEAPRLNSLTAPDVVAEPILILYSNHVSDLIVDPVSEVEHTPILDHDPNPDFLPESVLIGAPDSIPDIVPEPIAIREQDLVPAHVSCIALDPVAIILPDQISPTVTCQPIPEVVRESSMGLIPHCMPEFVHQSLPELVKEHLQNTGTIPEYVSQCNAPVLSEASLKPIVHAAMESKTEPVVGSIIKSIAVPVEKPSEESIPKLLPKPSPVPCPEPISSPIHVSDDSRTPLSTQKDEDT